MTPLHLSLTLVSLLMSGSVLGDVFLDSTDTPACDPNVVGKEALKKHFPSGPPSNLAQTIMENGPYSYVVLSKVNVEVPEAGKDAECVSVGMPTSSTATLTKKYYDNHILKEHGEDYTVTEKDYFLVYKKKGEKHSYRIYPLFLKNNVLITYKCCEKCSGKTPNVGIAVPDKMLDDSATKATVAEAKKKLQGCQLDKDVRKLKSCSKVKIIKV